MTPSPGNDSYLSLFRGGNPHWEAWPPYSGVRAGGQSSMVKRSGFSWLCYLLEVLGSMQMTGPLRPTESDSPHTVPLPSPTSTSSQAKWSWVHQVLRIPGGGGSTPSQALLEELQVTRFLSSRGAPHYRGGEEEEVSSVSQSTPPTPTPSLNQTGTRV